MSQNCAYLLPNTRSTHTVKNCFPPMTAFDLELTPSEIMTSRETQELQIFPYNCYILVESYQYTIAITAI